MNEGRVVAISEDGTTELVQVSATDHEIVLEGRYAKDWEARAVELIVDPDVKMVLEFMQDRLPACKLVAVADCLSPMARLLWGHYSSESCYALTLSVPKTPNPSPLSASESGPGIAYAGGDSEAARGVL